MNRRDFLSRLGLLAAAAATPKLIFDLGANSHIYTGDWKWLDADLTADPFRRVGWYTSTAFLTATPIIAQEIVDFSHRHPTWLSEFWEAAKNAPGARRVPVVNGNYVITV